MVASDDEWDWKFTDSAERGYDTLQSHEQDRIVSKLDEIVSDQWRDPSDYLEPLTGVPHSKLRIGAFRLGCKAVQTDQILWIYTIEALWSVQTGRRLTMSLRFCARTTGHSVASESPSGIVS